MTHLARGTKIRTTYEYSQRGTIVRYEDMDNVPGRPDLKGLTDWYLVKYEDGSRGCCHRDMMIVRND